jgi:CDP-glycerol glycerophosphotransferase
MYHEWLVKFPYLEGTFKLYDKFNTLISVSMSVNESNIDKINKAFSIEKSKFRFCNNCIEFDEINELSEIDLDLNEFHLFNEAKGIKFITMGRLSPEKGHAKLIDAFYHIYRHNPEAKLFILGDGPLKHELITKVDALGLQDVVFLLGQQINPFPYLKRADCFVFSSDHEGQGLVLLEALSLGVPTISTDIPGPRSVLEGGYGLLVENSVAGLTEGMIQFLNGELSFKSFNSRQYQQEAIEMFYSNVCNNLPLVTQQQKAAV